MLMVGIFSTGIQKERDKNASWMVFLGSIYPLAKVFRLILDFMRSDVLPPRACFMKVYNEALYLSFDYLIGKIWSISYGLTQKIQITFSVAEKLSVTQPVAGKEVRDCFLRGTGSLIL